MKDVWAVVIWDKVIALFQELADAETFVSASGNEFMEVLPWRVNKEMWEFEA